LLLVSCGLFLVSQSSHPLHAQYLFDCVGLVLFHPSFQVAAAYDEFMGFPYDEARKEEAEALSNALADSLRALCRIAHHDTSVLQQLKRDKSIIKKPWFSMVNGIFEYLDLVKKKYASLGLPSYPSVPLFVSFSYTGKAASLRDCVVVLVVLVVVVGMVVVVDMVGGGGDGGLVCSCARTHAFLVVPTLEESLTRSTYAFSLNSLHLASCDGQDWQHSSRRQRRQQ
jgi:hypothetical protein